MNQSLINELRARETRIRVVLRGIEESGIDPATAVAQNLTEYSQLLLAQSNCLNGIAVLVAANKVAR